MIVSSGFDVDEVVDVLTETDVRLASAGDNSGEFVLFGGLE